MSARPTRDDASGSEGVRTLGACFSRNPRIGAGFPSVLQLDIRNAVGSPSELAVLVPTVEVLAPFDGGGIAA